MLLMLYNSEQTACGNKLLVTALPGFTVESLTNSAGIQLYSLLHDRSPQHGTSVYFYRLRVVIMEHAHVLESTQLLFRFTTT